MPTTKEENGEIHKITKAEANSLIRNKISGFGITVFSVIKNLPGVVVTEHERCLELAHANSSQEQLLCFQSQRIAPPPSG